MKKIMKFFERIVMAELLLSSTFGFVSCLSTRKTGEPVEPAFVVEDANLPDGTVVSVQLFATGDEVQTWWKQLHPEQMHAKYELAEKDSSFAQGESNGYFNKEYSVSEFGELAVIMQENSLRYGRGELFIGTELRSIYFRADKKYKKFFFLRVDYLDEEGEKRLQAIKDEEEAARERERAEVWEQIERNRASSPRVVVTTTENIGTTQIIQNTTNTNNSSSSVQTQNNSVNHEKTGHIWQTDFRHTQMRL